MEELNIPGYLHCRTWQDFGTNRTQAFELARGTADYHWVIDADDLVVGELIFPEMTLPAYQMKYGKEFTYNRLQVFSDKYAWRYVGVLHEYPTCDEVVETGVIGGDYYIESRRIGARSADPDKYKKDAAILEEALLREPDNARYWFYLGQSYFDAKEYSKALSAYQRRADMGGWEQEVYYSKLRVGICMELLTFLSRERVICAYMNAYEYRPTRAEALYRLALFFRQEKFYECAAMVAKQGLAIPPSKDILFVNEAVTQYLMKEEFSISAYYCSANYIRREGEKICKELMEDENIPEENRLRAKKNYECYINQPR
jgi:tetratricopeptide (TPR) repeat protein